MLSIATSANIYAGKGQRPEPLALKAPAEQTRAEEAVRTQTERMTAG